MSTFEVDLCIDGIKLPGGETFTVGQVGFRELMVFTD